VNDVEVTEILSHQQAGYAAIIATSFCITAFTFIANRLASFLVSLSAKLRRLENFAARECNYDPED